MGTHQNRLAEVILMSTHNICFYGELTKIILQLSSNTHLICSSVPLHVYVLQMSCDITKPTKWLCAQRRLRSAWASAWRKLGSLATHWAHSEDSDQTGRMPRLIWGFTGRTCHCWFCHEVAQMYPVCNTKFTSFRKILIERFLAINEDF